MYNRNGANVTHLQLQIKGVKKKEISAISIHVFARKKIVLSLQVSAKKSAAVGADNNEATSKSIMSVLHANGDHESRKSCHKTFTNTLSSHKKTGPDFSKGLKQPLNFFSEVNLGESFLSGCSVSSAHGAQTKVILRYPPVSVKRSLVLQNSQISQNRPFCPTVPFILVVARFEIGYSMTLLLITSACHGNFVRQNRNALFWWDCDPCACPKAHLGLNVTVARF